MNILEKNITEFLNILYQFTGKSFNVDMFYLEKNGSYLVYKLKKDTNFYFLLEHYNSFYSFHIENISISKDTFVFASISKLKVIFNKNKKIEVTSSFYFKDLKFDLIYIKENNNLKLNQVYSSDLKTFRKWPSNIEKFNNYTKKYILKYNYEAEKIIPNYNIVSVFDFRDKQLQDQLNLFNMIKY